jgi:hypothetical protein
MLDMVRSNRCLYNEVNKPVEYKKYHFQTGNRQKPNLLLQHL